MPDEVTWELTTLDKNGVASLLGRLPSGSGIEVRVEAVLGAPSVRAVTLFAFDGSPQSVTARSWHSLAVGSVIDQALVQYRELTGHGVPTEAPEPQDWAESWQRAPGRHGHTDEMYAGLAHAYTSLVAGGTRKPIEDLAALMGAGRGTTSQRLQTARARGLLEGHQLTVKAVEILGLPVLDLTVTEAATATDSRQPTPRRWA